MDAAQALAAWAEFPIHARTRPLVITGPLLQESGFVSGEAKLAFLDQRLEMSVGVPEAAATSLAAEIGPLVAGPGHVLGVLSATRIRHAFPTDRGLHELTAWSLEISETLAPIIVVDIHERARMWHAPDHCHSAGTAHCLDQLDTRFRYDFVGSPRRYDDYDGADVTASATAVTVSPRKITRVRGNAIRLAYAESRRVEFSLPAPLGPRVLIDAIGNPIEVLHNEHRAPPR